MTLHREVHFEDEICADLAAAGWLQADDDAAAYDRSRALFPADVLAWVQATQPAAWAGLSKNHGAAAEATLLDRLFRQTGPLLPHLVSAVQTLHGTSGNEKAPSDGARESSVVMVG